MRALLLFLVSLCLFSYNGASQVSISDTISYSLGQSLGAKLKMQGASKLDYQSLLQGIADALDGSGGQLDRLYSDSLNYAYFQSQKISMFTKVKEEGERYLATNGQRPEVVTTASGLQYEVLNAADGIKPTATSMVTVHYEGMLLNGKLFDSSVARGEPATFPLNRVIKGWTEGLQLMSPGAKYRFYIPQELGYGDRGAGADIPPYSALIFDVELIAVK